MDQPRFLKACRRRPVDRIPVWMMRQAGRYMAEYRALRKRYEMLEVCKTPELALQVTMQPIKRFDLDAAIIFADILLPLEGMGVPFGFEPNHGPVIHDPVDSLEKIDAVQVAEIEESLGYVLEAIRLVRAELDDSIALIGFAGAPFTLASYMIEGGGSRNYLTTKRLMLTHPRAWHRLMETVSETTWRYLAAQAEAGAQALQLFDSWVGCLSPRDYDEFVFPHVRSIFQRLQDKDVPLIYFGTNTSTLLPRMKQSGCSVLGVDWRLPLEQAFELAGDELAVQGNLDPAALFAPRQALLQQVEAILQESRGRRGYIFNLGHGILPGTPVENVEAVIDYVHASGS
ncbi:MAG TPA: uroporphyrinogen decarboxylase [Acidobacteriota bacterium]|nr:uroporphyrinogen decarboxylase [Acidobacteriota bacterium]